MNPQADFDKTIRLLEENEQDFIEIERILHEVRMSKVGYHAFNNPTSPGVSKKNILGTYQIRASIEADRDNSFVEGYDTLLPRLIATKHQAICISSIISDLRSYFIFSDFEKSELSGLLVSKRGMTSMKANNYDINSDSSNIMFFESGRIL